MLFRGNYDGANTQNEHNNNLISCQKIPLKSSSFENEEKQIWVKKDDLAYRSAQ